MDGNRSRARAEPQKQAPLPALAVIDWGIGGFGVVREYLRRHPKAAYTYLSDSGFTPYGKVSAVDLARRLAKIGQFLADRGVLRIVVACNAASTVLDKVDWPRTLRSGQVIGTLDAAEQVVLASRARRVGIIGGKRTILSRALKRRLAARGLDVKQRIAQPLSALIEKGVLDGDEIHSCLRPILAPLRTCDALLLACTHYPALADSVWQRHLPNVQILDPAGQMVAREREFTGKTQLFCTGDARSLAASAKIAFGVTAPTATKVSI